MGLSRTLIRVYLDTLNPEWLRFQINISYIVSRYYACPNMVYKGYEDRVL